MIVGALPAAEAADTSLKRTAVVLQGRSGVHASKEGQRAMKPMTEEHLAILRRHMVEVIALHFDLASEEIGKDKLDARGRGGDVARAATSFRTGASRRRGLSRHPAADRLRQDRVAAVHLRADDRPSRSPAGRVGARGRHGLGYQAAVLAELSQRVWTVEVVEEFVSHACHPAQRTTATCPCASATARKAVDHAPFDKIIVTAAAERVPPHRSAQARRASRDLVGPRSALLTSQQRRGRQIETREVMPVRFSRLETVV